MDTHGSPGSYSETCEGSREKDKPKRMILEHVQWTEEHLLLNCTVLILNDLKLGIRSVIFSVDYGHIADETFISWWICLLKVQEWCLKSSDRESRWKPVELTSQNGFRHIWHLGTISGSLVPKMGIWHRIGIWSLLVFRYDIGSIGAIDAVQVTKFRHVFKGAVKLKVGIDFESDLQFEIGLMIGWLFIWLDNKTVTVFTYKARRRLLFRAGYLTSRRSRDFAAPCFVYSPWIVWPRWGWGNSTQLKLLR